MKNNDGPYVGPIYRVGKSLLMIPVIIFFIPAGIIWGCVHLKNIGHIILSILMAVIGFSIGVLYCSEIFNIREDNLVIIISIIFSIVFGIVGYIFAWKKAIPFNEMSMIQSSKIVFFQVLKMILILILALIINSFIQDKFKNNYQDAVNGIILALPIIYWLIILIIEKKKNE